MAEYKLDRKAFKICAAKDAPNNYLYWTNKPPEERLRAANYLNSVAYNFPENDPPRMDRSYFKIRKRITGNIFNKDSGGKKTPDDLENLKPGK